MTKIFLAHFHEKYKNTEAQTKNSYERKLCIPQTTTIHILGGTLTDEISMEKNFFEQNFCRQLQQFFSNKKFCSTKFCAKLLYRDFFLLSCFSCLS